MVVVRNLNPILSLEPTIVAPPDVAVPAIPLPNYGDPNGVAGPLSGGRGKRGGIGEGEDGGVGDRRGPGYGNKGDDGGISGPGGSIHGTLTPPILLVKIEPEYSDEARRAKIQGTVMLIIEVDTHGDVHNVSVKQSLGLGLDEKAIEAVSHWKFRPGTIDGKPAVISALVEVNFRLL
jgi:TonB family protein